MTTTHTHFPNDQHDHEHVDGPCPLCGDGSLPLFSSSDFGRLSLALTVGMDRHDSDALSQLFHGAISTRIAARVLDLGLQGRLVPCEIHESGEVLWRLSEEVLSPAEVTRYRSELQRASAGNTASAAGDWLTPVERRCLALATIAGFGDRGLSNNLEAIVQEWAEGVRDSVHDLEGILAGRLIPYASVHDEERLIYVKDFEELTEVEQIIYRRALLQLERPQYE